MAKRGSGTIRIGPNGLQSLAIISPTGDHAFRLIREPAGAEHYARRSVQDLEVKTSPNMDGYTAKHAAAFRLRARLDELNPDDWGDIVHVDDGECDCVIQRSGGEDLRVQVVRADVDEDRWRFMRDVPKGRFCLEDDFTVTEAVERPASAVEKKESRYDRVTKAALVLLLDAYNVPEASLVAVRTGLRSGLSSTGFQAVWAALGPHEDEKRYETPRDVETQNPWSEGILAPLAS